MHLKTDLTELTETKQQLELTNQKLEIANQQHEKLNLELALSNGKLTSAQQTISELRRERKEYIERAQKPKKWYQRYAVLIWGGVLFVIGVLASEYIREGIRFVLQWFSS